MPENRRTLRSQILLATGAPATVGKWRSRFVVDLLEGLIDEPRPCRPASISVEEIEAVVVATLEKTPTNARHWSRASMCEAVGEWAADADEATRADLRVGDVVALGFDSHRQATTS